MSLPRKVTPHETANACAPLVGAQNLGGFLASPDALQCFALLPQQSRQFQRQIGPAESRTAIKAAIEERYTAPA